MITLLDIVDAVENGEIPLSMAVELQSGDRLRRLWTEETDISTMCYLLESIGKPISPEIAIRIVAAASEYEHAEYGDWFGAAKNAIRNKANDKALEEAYDEAVRFTKDDDISTATQYLLAAIKDENDDGTPADSHVCSALHIVKGRLGTGELASFLRKSIPHPPTVQQIVAAARTHQ